MEQTHTFETAVTWSDNMRGSLSAGARQAAIAVGASPEFAGTEDVWSPEHLCVAAINVCMMLSFLTIAANSKLQVCAYSARSSGTLAKGDGGWSITRVVVKPRIKVGAGTDRARVERVLKLAHRGCFISNSLRGDVVLEPEIVAE